MERLRMERERELAEMRRARALQMEMDTVRGGRRGSLQICGEDRGPEDGDVYGKGGGGRELREMKRARALQMEMDTVRGGMDGSRGSWPWPADGDR